MANSVRATEFPAPGLRNPSRYITGHNSQGDAVFLQVRIHQYDFRLGHLSDNGQTDHGDHRDIMLGGIGAQSIFYSSASNPNELTGDVDLEFAAQNQVSLEPHRICVCRLIISSFLLCSPLFTYPMDVSCE